MTETNPRKVWKQSGTEPWLVPGYPPLTGEVGQAAVNEQIVVFPKVARGKVLPAPNNQTVGAVNFRIFKEPRTLSNGKPVAGFMRLVGNYGDEGTAFTESSKVIKEHDSNHKCMLLPVGMWMPITEETAFSKQQVDVKMKEQDAAIHGEAEREHQSRLRQHQRELMEREEELRNTPDVYDDPESINYYTMKRVTEMKLNEMRQSHLRELKKLDMKRQCVWADLKKIHREHPDYTHKWLDVYNEARAKTSIPPYVPGEDEFEEFEKFIGKDETPEEPDEPEELPRMSMPIM